MIDIFSWFRLLVVLNILVPLNKPRHLCSVYPSEVDVYITVCRSRLTQKNFSEPNVKFTAWTSLNQFGWSHENWPRPLRVRHLSLRKWKMTVFVLWDDYKSITSVCDCYRNYASPSTAKLKTSSKEMIIWINMAALATILNFRIAILIQMVI